MVYCHARLDRGVGSPVYMVNQTTRHQMRLQIRSRDHPGKEDEEDEDPGKEDKEDEDPGKEDEEDGDPGKEDEEDEDLRNVFVPEATLRLRELWRPHLRFLFYCSRCHKTAQTADVLLSSYFHLFHVPSPAKSCTSCNVTLHCARGVL